jgi:cell division protease FtsH
MEDFEDAKEKVMLGPERRSLVLSEDDKRITAYHEAGHAVVAFHCENTDPVHKVTIIPRGQALGVTFTPAEKDVYHHSREKYLDQICMALGGRVAEEIFLGKIHSGAYSDIKAVTRTARYMVAQVGMSETLGPIAYDESTEQVFLGRDYTRTHSHSEKTLQTIDDEVKRIVAEQMDRARGILDGNRDKVETMVAALLERESLERDEVDLVMRGEPLPEPKVELPQEARRGEADDAAADAAAAATSESHPATAADTTDGPSDEDGAAAGDEDADATGRPEGGNGDGGADRHTDDVREQDVESSTPRERGNPDR